MSECDLQYDEAACERCETVDCLTRCQYIDLDLESARAERSKILAGEDSRVLRDCVTCYACEERCPNGNHPFYLVVERQEQREAWPAPVPVIQQQVGMMAPKGRIATEALTPPIIDLCAFRALQRGCIRGSLFEGCSVVSGTDIFCNVMWLHFARNSVIRERLPAMIANIWTHYLEPSGTDEIVCFHDECYAAYTHLAPAFGIEVPFRPIHLFDFLCRRLEALKDRIRPLGIPVVYQRPCSSRLVPEEKRWVDEIFRRIGVKRVDRTYDGDDALCCGGVFRAQQRDELADDVQERNLADMKAAGATVCVFNCPFCLFTLGEATAERGLIPILMSDLCLFALGEGRLMKGV